MRGLAIVALAVLTLLAWGRSPLLALLPGGLALHLGFTAHPIDRERFAAYFAALALLGGLIRLGEALF